MTVWTLKIFTNALYYFNHDNALKKLDPFVNLNENFANLYDYFANL